MPSKTALISIATAVPPYVATQDTMERFMLEVLTAVAPSEDERGWRGRLRAIYRRSAIAQRWSVLPDYAACDPRQFEFYPRNWRLEPFPTTAARMVAFERESVALAERAGRLALERAALDPEEITHLVVSTCTGFFAPGPDVILCQRLGLSPAVERTTIGFMGCHAGFNGLRVADAFVGASPRARVLQITVELCSLHMQREVSVSSLLGTALFSDGAAAAVWGATPEHRRRPSVRATASRIAADTSSDMTWRIGDTGFVMHLSNTVPAALAGAVGPFVDELLERAELRRADIGQWCIHPGGPRIISSVAKALDLTAADTRTSYEVLRDFGNMSSATIFFVLERALTESDGRPIVLLGFGPGLNLEGAILGAAM